MVTIDDVRAYVADLPRSYEAFVRGRVKYRVGQIVYLAFSKDQTLMGFAFPRESDMRFNWVVARLDALSQGEMEEYVIDAWRMVVPKFVARDELLRRGELPDGDREHPEPKQTRLFIASG